ncbi:neurocan core protein-like [Acanthaster planci]|uniref:Neurocan core protein-like n=1 Tax=Acanthaster planci TaxID=133434 RepID=A0A8B7YAT6_ACAPL|nr:neurocan core protein-like [Acanthaster planci]
MFFVNVFGIVAICTAINTAWGSSFCPSLPTMKCSCPSGWQLWQKACYRLTESKANWENSKSACQEIGGKMAAPRSLKEMNFMAELAKKKVNNYYVWIACNDIEVEGNWTCDVLGDGDPFMGWQPGQPDNVYDQDCAGIAARHNDKMDDDECIKNYEAVCVRHAVCSPRSTQLRHFCFSSDYPSRFLNATCLFDHVIREFTTEGVTACGSACIKEPGCRSFNIKKSEGRKLCQLNNSTRLDDKDKFQNTSYFCMYLEECIG